MSLDIYFSEDVARVTHGLELTANYLEPGDFQSGYLACLQAVRASFGLPITVLVIPTRKGDYEKTQPLLATTQNHSKRRSESETP